MITKDMNIRGLWWDFLFFVAVPGAYLYWAILSKLLPVPEEGGLLRWIAQDRFVVLLLPSLVPVAVIWIFLNWLALKYLRTN